MVKFTKQTIKIATDPRSPVPTQPVEALVLGELAWYAVTHIPTGFSLAGGRQRKCKALVAELFALNLNWKFDVHFMTDEIMEKALPIIRAFRG